MLFFSIGMFTNCLQNLLNRRININNNYVPLYNTRILYFYNTLVGIIIYVQITYAHYKV